MRTYIALLRGINVGGNNILPMKSLSALLVRAGLENVRTYIQSGNAVFRSVAASIPNLVNEIQVAIRTEFGFEPRLLLLTIEEFEQAIESNPFPNAVSDPKSLHLFFLSRLPSGPAVANLQIHAAELEQIKQVDRVLYLHAPTGIGKSKLAARIEKIVGVPVTARNWRTVSKLYELALEIQNHGLRAD